MRGRLKKMILSMQVLFYLAIKYDKKVSKKDKYEL